MTNGENSSGLENVSPIIDWNKCHTSEQLNSIATTKNDLGVDCIVDVLGSYTDLDIPYKREIAENILAKLPSVTPQEPKTGHWKYFQNEKGDWMNVCSNCNSDCGVGYPYNYCPNCGCRMER